MDKKVIRWTILCCLLVTFGSAQVNIEGGQQFACPDERVPFTCSGSGSLMALYAPPDLSFDDRASFASTDTPGGNGFVVGAFTAVLLATSPQLVGQLTITSSSIASVEVICVIDPGSNNGTTSYIMASNVTDRITSPSVTVLCGSDDSDDVIQLRWNAPTGNFNIDYYEVSVFGQNQLLRIVNTTDTFVDVAYERQSSTATVYGSIIAVSRCGVRSAARRTPEVSSGLCSSFIAVIVVMSLLGGAVVVLVPVVVILGYKLKKKH